MGRVAAPLSCHRKLKRCPGPPKKQPASSLWVMGSDQAMGRGEEAGAMLLV